jgi:hypothetical protein
MLCTTQIFRSTALVLTAFAAVLSGCALPPNPRQDAEFQSYSNAASRPVVRPTRSISSFSDSLACMDRLFRAAEMPTTLLTSKQIPDASNRMPIATKEMIITAISQMSRLSNAFRYVDYEVDIARQDTVQNLTTILLNNNQIQLQRPALYITGAISFADQNVMSNQVDVGTSASRLETGFGSNRNATIIGIDLHLGDFRTRTLIPGLDSANEIVIGTGSQGFDAAARIGKYGVTFNVGRDYAQGSGAAVRTLVELAMIELVGKWARVPYWQCLSLDQTHPDFQRVLRDWHDDTGEESARTLVKNSLTAQGYISANAARSELSAADLRAVLARFQADQGMVPTGVLDYDTFERALRSFVTLGEDGKLVRIGWASRGITPVITRASPATVTVTAVTSPTATVAALSPLASDSGSVVALPLSLDMQIENLGDKTTFESGQQIFASAVVNRTAHLHCYMVGADQNVMRIVPNSTNPNPQISANQAIRIPDWMSPNPGFVLEAGDPGPEGVLCLATERDISMMLPEQLRGASFTAIANFKGMQSIMEAYSTAAGNEDLAIRSLQWKAIARRAAAAARAPAAAAPAPAAGAAAPAPAPAAR